MRCKRETDGRRLDEAGKEAIRLRAVRMVNKGLSPERVAKDLDINRRTIYSWLEKYHYGGWQALKRKPRPDSVSAAPICSNQPIHTQHVRFSLFEKLPQGKPRRQV